MLSSIFRYSSGATLMYLVQPTVIAVFRAGSTVEMRVRLQHTI